MPIRILFASCIALMFFIKLACAGEAEIIRLTECKEVGADPSLQVQTAVAPGRSCTEGNHQFALTIRDRRLGIVWWLKSPKGSGFIHELIEPEKTDVADSDALKPCVKVYPGALVVDEWFVPKDRSCKGRESDSTIYRRYTAGRICIMPKGDCIEVAKLKPIGRERVGKSILVAISSN